MVTNSLNWPMLCWVHYHQCPKLRMFPCTIAQILEVKFVSPTVIGSEFFNMRDLRLLLSFNVQFQDLNAHFSV